LKLKFFQNVKSLKEIYSKLSQDYQYLKGTDINNQHVLLQNSEFLKAISHDLENIYEEKFISKIKKNVVSGIDLVEKIEVHKEFTINIGFSHAV